MRDDRGPEALRRHYEIERALAARLRDAPAQERRTLYGTVYDELFRAVPDHPQNRWKADAARREADVAEQVALACSFLPPGGVYVELGAGDEAVARGVARRAAQVYAVEVSEEIGRDAPRPANVARVLSDGTSVPVPPAGAHVAFSNQLMEHLHPDDALAQLRQVAAALAPGGVYVCITPNALSGPHDISKFFDADPTGFHLREYTNRQLRGLLRAAGFGRVRGFIRLRGRTVVYPLAWPIALETVLARCGTAGRRLARRRVPRGLLGNRIVATRA
jgi:SAM-dependent methyltransferase